MTVPSAKPSPLPKDADRGRCANWPSSVSLLRRRDPTRTVYDVAEQETLHEIQNRDHYKRRDCSFAKTCGDPTSIGISSSRRVRFGKMRLKESRPKKLVRLVKQRIQSGQVQSDGVTPAKCGNSSRQRIDFFVERFFAIVPGAGRPNARQELRAATPVRRLATGAPQAGRAAPPAQPASRYSAARIRVAPFGNATFVSGSSPPAALVRSTPARRVFALTAYEAFAVFAICFRICVQSSFRNPGENDLVPPQCTAGASSSTERHRFRLKIICVAVFQEHRSASAFGSCLRENLKNSSGIVKQIFEMLHICARNPSTVSIEEYCSLLRFGKMAFENSSFRSAAQVSARRSSTRVARLESSRGLSGFSDAETAKNPGSLDENTLDPIECTTASSKRCEVSDGGANSLPMVQESTPSTSSAAMSLVRRFRRTPGGVAHRLFKGRALNDSTIGFELAPRSSGRLGLARIFCRSNSPKRFSIFFCILGRCEARRPRISASCWPDCSGRESN